MRRLSSSLLCFFIGYATRVSAQSKRLIKLIPNEMTIQYAGNVGLNSVGLTWDYAKDDCLETTVLLGYVPAYSNYSSTICLSAREMYTPWRLHLTKNVDFSPVSTGMMVSFTFGEDFWVVEPDYFPDHYYGFSSSVRFFVLLGQQFDFNIKTHSGKIKKISFYYQANTYDLMIIDYCNSKYLKLWDIIGLGLGLKIQL